MSTGWLMNNCRTTYNYITECNVYSCLLTQTRHYAARKGTRERARVKKVKQVVEKREFIGHKMKIIGRTKGENIQLPIIDKINDSWKSSPIDNVWITKYHKQKVYSLKEAIEFHRETHHPTMYNLPKANITAFIELNMQIGKKTKPFIIPSRVIESPHFFKHNESRTILALCKSQDQQKAAINAGATRVGGVEIIKSVQSGELCFADFQFTVAHTDIAADLLIIRGLLKRRFPTIRLGTLGNDMSSLVKKFKYGIYYTPMPDENDKFYSKFEVKFGTLDMDVKQLEENFTALINDVESLRPTLGAPFILRTHIRSQPSTESFKINFKDYLSKRSDEGEEEEEEEEEQHMRAVIDSV